jgi:hypothetical protein
VAGGVKAEWTSVAALLNGAEGVAAAARHAVAAGAVVAQRTPSHFRGVRTGCWARGASPMPASMETTKAAGRRQTTREVWAWLGSGVKTSCVGDTEQPFGVLDLLHHGCDAVGEPW